LKCRKHLARGVHDLYCNPRHEEFAPRTMWSLSNAFTSAFKELDPIPQFKARCEPLPPCRASHFQVALNGRSLTKHFGRNLDANHTPTGARILLQSHPRRSTIRAMATHVTLPALRRKRGNPNWGRPIAAAPALATEFELRVRQLQLTPEMYASSLVLRTWCEQNRNRVYVPEWLLAEWGITVDPYFSDAA
jgi:hypothetical protein